MNNVTLFKSDLFMTKIGTDEQRLDLKNQILDAKENNQASMADNNDLCWRSEVKYKNIEWLTDSILNVTKSSIDYYVNEDQAFQDLISQGLINIDYWTNVNEPGSNNILHSHISDSFTAVYYVQGTDTGGLRFKNPANLLNNLNMTSPFCRDCVIYPEDGDLLLWPGRIPHEVDRNESNKKRINLAFSIKIF